jgi:hypothetical protein
LEKKTIINLPDEPTQIIYKIQLLSHIKHSVFVSNASLLMYGHGVFWHVACALRWSGKERLGGDGIHQARPQSLFSLI